MKPYPKRIAKTLIWLLCLYLLIGISIWAFSPLAVRKISNSFLEEHGVSTSANTLVRLNPFSSNLKIENFVLVKSDKTKLAISSMTLKYRFWPILKKTFIIEKISLKGAKIDIQQLEDLVVAGVSLGKNIENKPANKGITEEADGNEVEPQSEVNVNQTDNAPTFFFEIKTLVIEEFEINYSSTASSHKATIERLSLTDFTHKNGNIRGDCSLLVTAAGGNIEFSAQFEAAAKSANLSLDFTSERIELNEFANWLPPNSMLRNSFLDFSFKLSTTAQNLTRTLTIDDIKFNLTNPEKERDPPIFEATSIHLPDIQQTLNGITISQIDFSNPILRLSFGEEKTAIEDASSSELNSSENQESNGSQQITSEEASTAIKIDSIVFSKPGMVTIKDFAQSPAFIRELRIGSLQIDNIDTADPNAITKYNIVINDDNYLNITLGGEIQLFSEKINLKAAGTIQELALPPLNNYTNDLLGLGFELGQLNSEINLNVTEDQLGGDIELHLKGVKFSSTDEVDTLSVVDQSAMPLNVALNFLKDSDGNIELKIPLSGDISDPEFGKQKIINLVVKKAIMQQTKRYLVNTFLPYANVITVAMMAGEQALKVRFEDLAYDLGQIDISSSQSAYMDQLAALVKEKKNLRLQVCAYATLKEGTDKAERKNIAKNRANAFKHYLVETKFVNSDRILVCEPKTDIRENALPRVEIGE